MPISKPQKGSSGRPGTGGGAAADGLLSPLYPTLWMFLTDSVYADGEPRVLATLTLFVEGGLFKLCLNDRDLDRTAWSSGVSLADAADAMEGHLREDRVEWRVRQQGGPGGKRR